MPRRVLGRTGQQVSIFGLGCAYAGGGVGPQETWATIEAALEGGVRYFDSAPEYTHAEERLGPVVARYRDEVFLTTKTYAQDAVQAEKDLNQALKNLKTDHVDLFMQHGVGLDSVSDPAKMLGDGGSLSYLRKAKEGGLTRFIGMSVHTPHSVALTLLKKSDEWDVVMPFINFVEHAGTPRESSGDDLLAVARRRRLGIVAMKVLGGNPGLLAEKYDLALRYALSVPDVACAVIGCTNPDQVRRAVQAAKAFRPLTGSEMDHALTTGRRMVRDRSREVRVLALHRQRGYVGGVAARDLTGVPFPQA